FDVTGVEHEQASEEHRSKDSQARTNERANRDEGAAEDVAGEILHRSGDFPAGDGDVFLRDVGVRRTERAACKREGFCSAGGGWRKHHYYTERGRGGSRVLQRLPASRNATLPRGGRKICGADSVPISRLDVRTGREAAGRAAYG